MMSAHLSFAAFRRACVTIKIGELNSNIIPRFETILSRPLQRIQINIPTGAEVIF
jgi:hypothetical protein